MTYRREGIPAAPAGRAEVVAALRVFYEARDQMDPITDDDLWWAMRHVSEFVGAVDEFIDSIRATFGITNGEVG